MVVTRSSPRKRPPPVPEPVPSQSQEDDLEEEVPEEDVPEEALQDPKKAKAVVEQRKKLAPRDSNPPKLFILPKDASQDARIATLPDPGSGARNRYYVCPEKGIYEFTRVNGPTRSVLLAPTWKDGGEKPEESAEEEKDESKRSISQGYVTKDANIFIATLIDPIFHMIPILAPETAKAQKRLYVTFDDHIDNASATLQEILRQPSLRALFEARLDAICETVEAGDESMYRISMDKLALVLVAKAKKMTKNGLPASMEEHFIRKTLAAPILSIKREDTTTTQQSQTETPSQPDATAGADASQATDSQSTPPETQSTTFSKTSATTSMTSIPADSEEPIPETVPTYQASPEVQQLLRLRTSLAYIQDAYLPPHIHTELSAPISKIMDFSPLDSHLKKLAAIHEEARALRALSDNISRKRGLEDDEEMEARAEKKRKKEEEDKRKKMASNAAKALKKVDTSGMKKLSSFFSKAPPKKK